MVPDLSEKLLGIDIDDADDPDRRNADGPDEDEVELEQFVYFGLGDDRFALPVDAIRTLAEVSEQVTRVPRSPDAIEGMIDLRGEITAVIDPHVHFPGLATDEQVGRERLLVLDRPADQQSVAIRVDDVMGVETVPVSDVHDEASLEESPLSGDALAHPLVVALIEQEREVAPDVDRLVSSSQPETAIASETGGETDFGGATALSPPAGESPDGPGTVVGKPFELETDESAESEPVEADDERARELVVDGTPLLDVENLLLASGQQA
ncbi:chemotaxis protein CheW [Natronorubrum texcoconense]|uniref:CheW-like domain-containing protein n=1 Tax=Natronorubrum texcoconense TaxID=1095776 RepID=A0A1G8XU83_9EURY|nr:chemotaxis protein CheW [Natronorubrum texcoconense]SDJ93455.1 CheW-like domain-containing protein [Natronorubrum texcoconense]